MALTIPPQFIGIPWLDRGRDPVVGLDCWGLVRHWYRLRLGLELPSLVQGYAHAHDRHAVAALVARESAGWVPVPTAPQADDLVTLLLAGRPWHVGVVLDERHFLHTLEGHGSVIGRLDAPLWSPRIDGFWRFARHPEADLIR